MPKIERIEKLESKHWPIVARYECDCEDEVTFYCKTPPKKLFKCWECLEKYNK